MKLGGLPGHGKTGLGAILAAPLGGSRQLPLTAIPGGGIYTALFYRMSARRRAPILWACTTSPTIRRTAIVRPQRSAPAESVEATP